MLGIATVQMSALISRVWGVQRPRGAERGLAVLVYGVRKREELLLSPGRDAEKLGPFLK